MKFCGIICEFNPFHNGHEYIIEQAKEKSKENVICLMSGDFVQRGTPAIVDKYVRAKSAIMAGASMVVELPTIYACSNAENFAYGAIKILKNLGADTLAFGVENASLEILQEIAKIKYESSEKFTFAFKNEIENGINFNTAQKRAIIKTLGRDVSEILNKPNNILAIEYLTAILKLNAKIQPIAIERTDNGFTSNQNKGKFMSASGIRELIKNRKNISNYVPNYANIDDFFSENAKIMLEKFIIKKIQDTPASALENCYDYNEGIEFRVKKCAEESPEFEKIVSSISTPRYREARVNKLLLYPLLNITKSLVHSSKKCKPAVKVLAVAKQNKQLLANFSKSKISLIVTNKDYENLSSIQKKIISVDLAASNLYGLLMNLPYNQDKKIGTLFI